MLSILIPVYNFDVRELVRVLCEQCEATAIGFEILLFDDGSSDNFKNIHREFYNRENLIYRELEKNIGRAAIRNLMAESAQFEYLLFLDCDGGVVDNNFIYKYLKQLKSNRLLYGGRCYAANPPQNSDYFFHWFYGSRRESQEPQVRQKQPYASFMTNNFLMDKKTFLAIKFDEQLRQYGHEDTLFGLELEKKGLEILHFDNPIEHLGLETTSVFLQKTRLAVENLHYLFWEKNFRQTRLLSAYKKLKYKWLRKIAAKIFLVFEKKMVRNLASEKPSLLVFDFYKLGYLCTLTGGN